MTCFHSSVRSECVPVCRGSILKLDNKCFLEMLNLLSVILVVFRFCKDVFDHLYTNKLNYYCTSYIRICTLHSQLLWVNEPMLRYSCILSSGVWWYFSISSSSYGLVDLTIEILHVLVFLHYSLVKVSALALHLSKLNQCCRNLPWHYRHTNIQWHVQNAER